MQGRTCLVTGAAGFIGSHLVRRLVAQGADVHALVRPGSAVGRLFDCRDAIKIHYADLRDDVSFKSAVNAAQPELVFHLASPSRGFNTAEIDVARRSVDDFVKPLFNLVEALGELPVPPTALIRAGTIAEYGTVPLPYRERQRERPRSAYGAAMLAGTHFLQMLEPAMPFSIVTARLALTYGPGQSSSFLVPAMVDACLAGRPLRIERPDDRRDLIHVDDVVAAFIALAETRNVKSGVINVATGTAPSMREVAAEVISATRCDPKLVEQGRQLPGSDVEELRCDPSLAREMYSWGPRIGLRQGISQLIEAKRAELARPRQLPEMQAND